MGESKHLSFYGWGLPVSVYCIWLKGNMKEVSKGGRVLMNMTKKMGLIVVNRKECCKETWTRMVNGKKSVLDYFITNKEDIKYVKEMTIDEEKVTTPYRISDDNGVTYSDHCLMSITTEWMIEIKENKREETCIGQKGYTNYKRKLEEKQISNRIKAEHFQETYSKWSDTVIETVKECSGKRRSKKGWKVNRKLLTVKKNIQRQLQGKDLQIEEIHSFKIRKDLINEHIDKESHKKNYERVKEIRRIKEEGGIDSAAFWELKRRIEGKRTETAHIIEDEKGDIQEKRRNTGSI